MQAPLQARNDSDAAQTDTAGTVAQKRVLADNRPEAVAQRKLAEMMNNSTRVLQLRALSNAIHNSPRMVAQRHEMNALFGGAAKPHGDSAMPAEASLVQREEKTNKTGLPNQLKSGIESLSGMSMDHVTVHYNSDKPAQLQAHAYAQGSEIHLGTGQERHLPHEAWHVVQQARGRVRPTLQMKAGAVNDDPSLEKEADMMGEKAAQFEGDHGARNLVTAEREAAVTVPRVTGFGGQYQALANGSSRSSASGAYAAMAQSGSASSPVQRYQVLEDRSFPMAPLTCGPAPAAPAQPAPRATIVQRMNLPAGEGGGHHAAAAARQVEASAPSAGSAPARDQSPVELAAALQAQGNVGICAALSAAFLGGILTPSEGRTGVDSDNYQKLLLLQAAFEKYAIEYEVDMFTLTLMFAVYASAADIDSKKFRELPIDDMMQSTVSMDGNRYRYKKEVTETVTGGTVWRDRDVLPTIDALSDAMVEECFEDQAGGHDFSGLLNIQFGKYVDAAGRQIRAAEYLESVGGSEKWVGGHQIAIAYELDYPVDPERPIGSFTVFDMNSGNQTFDTVSSPQAITSTLSDYVIDGYVAHPHPSLEFIEPDLLTIRLVVSKPAPPAGE